MKKIIKIIIIISLIGSAFLFFYMKSKEVLSRDSVKIVKELKSPDEKYKCTIFLDEGSATVSDNIRISITKSDKKRIYNSDVVFLQNKTRFADAKWINNKELVISYREDSNIINNLSSFEDIKITYKKIESDF